LVHAGKLRFRVLLLVCFFLTLAYFAAVLKAWLAEHWGSSPDPAQLSRAIRLEPSRAEYHHRLGRLLLFDPVRSDPVAATAYLEQACELNPRAAEFWLDLARAYQSLGRLADVERALRRASEAYPASAPVAWTRANFYLHTGRLAESFAEFRRALIANPALAQLAFRLLWGATDDTEKILDEALPKTLSVELSALNYLLATGRLEDAGVVWGRVRSRPGRLPVRSLARFMDVLIREKRVSLALAVWTNVLEREGIRETALVADGGFERDSLEAGFDWRLERLGGVEWNYDSTAAHSGRRSLRLAFDGSQNFNFQHVWQYVPVEPNTRYRFRGFLRTESISTDSGLRFRIYDPYHPGTLDVMTSNLIGTQDWTGQELEFATGHTAQVVVIALRRLPSRKLDNKLRGTAWVDTVTLEAVSPR